MSGAVDHDLTPILCTTRNWAYNVSLCCFVADLAVESRMQMEYYLDRVWDQVTDPIMLKALRCMHFEINLSP